MVLVTCLIPHLPFEMNRQGSHAEPCAMQPAAKRLASCVPTWHPIRHQLKESWQVSSPRFLGQWRRVSTRAVTLILGSRARPKLRVTFECLRERGTKNVPLF